MSYATLAGFSVACDVVGTAAFYTPPIAREALKATFSLETTHFYSAGGAGVVVVTVQHKDLADASWVTAGTFADITATGVVTLTLSDLKEELRLKIAFSGGHSNDIAHLLLAAIAWLSD